MAWCLTEPQEAKFRAALVSGKIDPFKLADMSSEERRVLFEKYVDGENAININSLYESKLLLKNQQQGFETWAKRAIGMAPKVKRDLLSKIERLDEIGVLEPKTLKAFKEDLARTRLGFGITFAEAKTINELSEARVEAKDKWETELEEHPEWKENPQETRNEWKGNQARLDYGIKQVVLENYVNDVKLEAINQKVSLKEDPIKAVLNPIKAAPGNFSNLAKSLMASIDNSFFGRQGIKNLFGSPAQKRIWASGFVKSFGNIYTELRRGKKATGLGPMDFIKADIYSRPNALSGKYKAGNYQLDILHEEVFPTSVPEKIPGLGRLFRASETAFTGGALRMRADLADMLIADMDAQGINSLNSDQARAAGHLVGSLTGRGSLGKLTPISKTLNLVLWSARFVKSNIDTLTAHQFDNKATKFTKKVARKNLVSIVAHVAGIMLLAWFLDPDSVDTDPRSTNFGKIKIFGHWTDITGGMRGIAIMAARLTPTMHDGEWGVWRKSGTGNWTNLTEGKFGADDAVDVFIDSIFLNKLAPVASIIRDYYRGEMFGGAPFDIKKSIVNSSIPLSIQAINDVKDEGIIPVLAVAISEFFGLGVSTYKYQDNWERKTSKEMKQFKEQVGEQKFKDANEAYNRVYNAWFEEIEKNEKYKKLSDDGKSSLRSSAKSSIKKKILNEYGYDPTEEPESLKELQEKEEIKLLKPLSSLIDKAVKTLAKIDIVSDAIASEGGVGMDTEQRSRFDEIKREIDSLIDIVAKRKKSKLLSPQPIEVLTDRVKKLTKEGEAILAGTPLQEKFEPEKKEIVNNLGKNPNLSETTPPKKVDTVIRDAAKEFGVPSELLFDIAFAESSFDTTSENDNSTAAGLFQFLDASWKQAMRELGLPEDTPKTDEEASARAAAMVISKGRLSWWDDSKKKGQKWGSFYTDKELKPYDRRLK